MIHMAHDPARHLTQEDTTRILADLGEGDPTAAERLLPLVYDELRALARAYFRKQAPGLTLQPTALVHEAYLRLIGDQDAQYRGRAHFMAVAATAMRQILIDRARRQKSAKHGGGHDRITLNDRAAAAEERDVDVLALDGVLRRLAELDQRKSKVVEMRFFGGLSIEETALALNIARSTVTEDWRFARAWVLRELQGDAAA